MVAAQTRAIDPWARCFNSNHRGPRRSWCRDRRPASVRSAGIRWMCTWAIRMGCWRAPRGGVCAGPSRCGDIFRRDETSVTWHSFHSPCCSPADAAEAPRINHQDNSVEASVTGTIVAPSNMWAHCGARLGWVSVTNQLSCLNENERSDRSISHFRFGVRYRLWHAQTLEIFCRPARQ